MLLTGGGATCFSPGAGPLAGRCIISPAPARLEMTTSVPPDDGCFGLTSLRSKMTDEVYGDMLTLAAAARAANFDAAQLNAAEMQLKAAEMETKFVKEKARADRLRRELQDSKRALLINKGHVDLRGILADVLPYSKKEKEIERWLFSHTDRRHVRSAA